MKNKTTSVFAAAAISIGIGFAAPAAMTTVTSFAFVPEAHAGGYKKAKKAGKKVGSKANKGRKYIGRKAKKGAKAVGRGAKKVAKAIGRNRWARRIYKLKNPDVRVIYRSAKRAGKAIVRKGRAVQRAAKKLAKEYGKRRKCIVIRRCKPTIGRRQLGARQSNRLRSVVRVHRR